MPRRPRIKLAGIPQHIVQHGINREPCFFADEDYHSYLHWLEEAAGGWRLALFHPYLCNGKARNKPGFLILQITTSRFAQAD